MTKDTYEMAYVEVLEVLKHLPQEEYDKIPKEKIEYYEKYQDPNYFYQFDEYLPIEEQRISKKAKAIIITLFRDYFATQIQQQKLNVILQENSKKIEKEKNEKYNSDNIFKKYNKENKIEEKIIENVSTLVEYKESIFKRFINRIKNIFHIK